MKDTQATTSGLQIFESQEFGNITTIIKDGEPWFVGKEIADILGYSETSKMTKRLDADEKTTLPFRASGSNYQTNKLVINESGFYNAVIGSKKPEAKRFKKWVTGTVLPSIRKTGSYTETPSMPQDLPTALRLYADELELNQILLKDNKEKQSQLEYQKPKVVFCEVISGSKDLIMMGTMAKLLCNKGFPIGSKLLFEYLHIAGFLMRTKENANAPKQRYVNQGIFKTTESGFDVSGNVLLRCTTKVTPKGQQYIIKHFNKLDGQGRNYRDIIANHRAKKQGKPRPVTNIFEK